MSGLLDDPDYWGQLGDLLSGPGGPLHVRTLGLLGGDGPGVRGLPMLGAVPMKPGSPPVISGYHGSPQRNLTSISATPPKRQFDNATSQFGAFISPDRGYVERYYLGDKGKGRVYNAEVRGNLYEMPKTDFLKFQDIHKRDGKPIPPSQWDTRMQELKSEAAALREQLKRQGYDGIKVVGHGGEIFEVASFNDIPVGK